LYQFFFSGQMLRLTAQHNNKKAIQLVFVAENKKNNYVTPVKAGNLSEKAGFPLSRE